MPSGTCCVLRVTATPGQTTRRVEDGSPTRSMGTKAQLSSAISARTASPMNTQPLDLSRLHVRPLAERDSLTRADDVLLDPDAPPPALPAPLGQAVARCAVDVRAARGRGAGVILIYGAHLLRNG